MNEKIKQLNQEISTLSARIKEAEALMRAGKYAEVTELLERR